MLFIDLNKLKIIKEFNYKTQASEINLSFKDSFMSQSKMVVDYMQQLIIPSGLAISYDITINSNGGVASDEETEEFISIVNFLISVFFANMIQEDGRKREHRFDVPEKLQPVKVSRSIMKKAVNQKTINDIFNLTIHYKDLTYILCDEKEVKEEVTDA